MRRKSRQQQAPVLQETQTSSQTEPFGVWTQADLRALAQQRFPHRDSFPTARGLINRFLLQDGFLYRDLRIALFWLGFGLLEVPTVDEPTIGLVPLCKDLNTYADTAAELGYDPSASVHERPVCLLSEADGQPAVLPQGHHFDLVMSTDISGSGDDWINEDSDCDRATELGTAACSFRGPGPSSSSGAAPSHSSSSSSGPFPLGRPLTAFPWLSGGDGGYGVAEESEWEENVEDPVDSYGSRSSAWLDAATPQNSAARAARGQAKAGASVCSRGAGGSQREAWAWQDFDEAFDEENAAEFDEVDDTVSQAFTYKVKLLHAGGWSSSSGSEGHNTPPTPPASSSAAAHAAAVASAAAEAQQAGGLDADRVGQFTVSFVSDLQLHEDLEETSCLCTFCLDEMELGEELCRLPCMHTFHRRCVHAWLERDRRCMLCRLDITRPCG